MLRSARTVLLVGSLAWVGCIGGVDSPDVNLPVHTGPGGDNATGSGGASTNAPDAAGTGGAAPTASGGMTGAPGSGGMATTNGSGGGAGRAGTGGGGVKGGATGGVGSGGTGAAGHGGSGGSSGSKGGTTGSSGGSGSGGHAGQGGAGGGGGSPTFTMIYNTIVTPHCGGSGCHLKAPTPQGLNFSTQKSAYTAWSDNLTPGDAEDSEMFQTLNLGIMPEGQPSLSVDNLVMVWNWINAGALNN
jgi:hypothetical protein